MHRLMSNKKSVLFTQSKSTAVSPSHCPALNAIMYRDYVRSEGFFAFWTPKKLSPINGNSSRGTMDSFPLFRYIFTILRTQKQVTCPGGATSRAGGRFWSPTKVWWRRDIWVRVHGNIKSIRILIISLLSNVTGVTQTTTTTEQRIPRRSPIP